MLYIHFYRNTLRQLTLGEAYCSTTQQLIRERSSITSARYGGVGGLTENADSADALRGGWGSQVKNADVILEQTCSKSVTTMSYVKLSQ